MEKFAAVFEQDSKWWIEYLEELPGANPQGRTLEEARENLNDAVRSLIAANRDLTRRELQV
jgi:predicted RNase H-like HicB family nuclease